MQLPPEVPVMTLPNAILFPQAMLPLYIFEPRYRRMLADALTTHRMFSVAMRKPGRVREIPASVAGLGLIRASVTNRDGSSNLILQGIARVELITTVRYKPYRVHTIRPLPEVPTNTAATQALASRVLDLVRERLRQGLDLAPSPLQKSASGETGPDGEPIAIEAFRHVLQQLTKLETPEPLADLVSATLLPNPRERQVILETRDVEERLLHLISFLLGEIDRTRQNKLQ